MVLFPDWKHVARLFTFELFLQCYSDHEVIGHKTVVLLSAISQLIKMI